MELGSTQFTNVVAYVSLIVSSLLAIFYIRDRRNARYAIETDYCNQLLAWHALVIDVLIELCANSKQKDEKTKHLLLVKLSSPIEQGRFYFPNINPDEFGLDKPPAYRGYRNVALDFLVASYDLHQKSSNPDAQK